MYRKLFPLFEEAHDGDATSFVSGGVDAPSTADQPSEDGLDTAQWGTLAESFDQDEDDSLTVEGDLEVTADGKELPDAGHVDQSTPSTPTPVPAEQPSPTAPVAPLAPVTSQEPPAQPAAPPPEVYQTWKTAREKELEGLYTLTEEDAQAALTEPEKLLPKLAAKLHIGVLEASMRAMQAMMPVMLNQVNQATELNTKAKGLFQSVNPDLADPQYEPYILELGQFYRSKNRAASPEEASRAIGDLVRAAFGLARPSQAATQTPTQSVQPTPSAATPFSPVRGGGSRVGGQVKPLNPFEALDMEFKDDY